MEDVGRGDESVAESEGGEKELATVDAASVEGGGEGTIELHGNDEGRMIVFSSELSEDSHLRGEG